MKSTFLLSWTRCSSPLGKLFPAHLFAERDRTRRRRLGQGHTGQPDLGFQLQGHRCSHRRQMPAVGGIRAATCLDVDRKAAAHQRFPQGCTWGTCVSLQGPESVGALPQDTCVSQGPKHAWPSRPWQPRPPPPQHAGAEEPQRRGEGPPASLPLLASRSRAGAHLQVGSEDTEVGGQLRKPQV